MTPKREKSISPISKAVIPVAGLGTRMLPATKAIPKELLPLYDRPIIEHIVREAVDSGISEIIFITRSGKEAIENHFDSHYELEHRLTDKGKNGILHQIKRTLPSNIKISSIRQGDALGLGHAILCAEHAVAGEAFAVILPDMFLLDTPEREPNQSFRSLLEQWKLSGLGQILLGEVDDEQINAYGIADCGNNFEAYFQSTSVYSLVEKPTLLAAPSNLAILGRYIVPNNIFETLRNILPDADGEIQFTDALQHLVNTGNLQGLVTDADMYDCGNPDGFVLANVALGMRREKTKAKLLAVFEQQQNQARFGRRAS